MMKSILNVVALSFSNINNKQEKKTSFISILSILKHTLFNSELINTFLTYQSTIYIYLVLYFIRCTGND